MRSFISLVGSAAIALLAICGCSGGSISARPEALAIKPVQFSPPAIEQWTLNNGLKVYYLYDDEVPLIHGTLYLPGGRMYEPLKKSGLASAAGSLLRDGSIKGMSPAELDKKLDDLGASIESSAGEEYTTVSFSGLDEDFDVIFDLFAQTVLSPGFNRQRFELWRTQSLEGIKKRKEEPSTMAGFIFQQALFGEGTPYYNPATPKTISSITLADIRDFNRRFSRPNGARLVITGAIPKDKIQQAILWQFGSWPSTGSPLPEIPEPHYQTEPGVYVLKRDLVQATIITGQPGPPRVNPNMIPNILYNELFSSGGFSSRLFSEIRTKLGLAYFVHGGFSGGRKSGAYQIALGTRNDEALAATSRVLELIDQSRLIPPTESELADSKRSIANSFVFKFESSDDVVGRAVIKEILGYPQDWDEKYIERINSTDAERIRGVAEQQIDPNKMIIVLVGGLSAEDVAAKLQTSAPIYEMGFDTEPKLIRKLKK